MKPSIHKVKLIDVYKYKEPSSLKEILINARLSSSANNAAMKRM